MPARVLSFRDVAPKEGEYSLIVSALPGRGEQTIGVLLLDASSDTLHVRLRRDWERLASEEDAEVLAELEDDLLLQARDQGGKSVLDRLEQETSQFVAGDRSRSRQRARFRQDTERSLSPACTGAGFAIPHALAALFAGGGGGTVSDESTKISRRKSGWKRRRI